MLNWNTRVPRGHRAAMLWGLPAARVVVVPVRIMGGLNADQDDERMTDVVVDPVAPFFVYALKVGDLRLRELAREGGKTKIKAKIMRRRKKTKIKATLPWARSRSH